MDRVSGIVTAIFVVYIVTACADAPSSIKQSIGLAEENKSADPYFGFATESVSCPEGQKCDVFLAGTEPFTGESIAYEVGGEATLNSDYTLEWEFFSEVDAEGNIGKISLQIVDDEEIEAFEAIDLRLTEAPEGQQLGRSFCAARIAENDFAVVADDDTEYEITLKFTDETTEFSESDEEISLTLSVFPIAAKDLEYTVSLGDETGDNLVDVDGVTVTVPEGRTQTTFTVDVVNNNIYHNVPSPFEVVLDSADEPGLVSLAGTIANDDAVPTLTLVASSSNAQESTTDLTVTLSLTSALDSDLVVALGGSGDLADSEYSVSSEVTIPAGETTLVVPVTLNDDSDIEVPENLTISVNSVSASFIVDQPSVTIAVTDDD